jgi:hypothetical protein
MRSTLRWKSRTDSVARRVFWRASCFGVLAVLAPLMALAEPCTVPRTFDPRWPGPCVTDVHEPFVRNTHFARALSCDGAGRYAEGAVEARWAVLASPGDTRASFLLVVELRRSGKGAEAGHLLRRLVDERARSPEGRADDAIEADAAFAAGRYVRAFSLYRKSLFPGLSAAFNKPAYDDRGKTADFLHGFEAAQRRAWCEAIADWSSVLAAGSSFGEARFLAGAAEFARGDGAGARYQWEETMIAPTISTNLAPAGLQWSAARMLAITSR